MGDPIAIIKAAFDSVTVHSRFQVVDTPSENKFIGNTHACMMNDTTLAFVHVYVCFFSFVGCGNL